MTKIRSSHRAFAAILADGRVVTWGSRHSGGDSTAVQGQLRQVEEVASTARAFAAILADGSVVTWGDRFCGGDCSSVKDELRNFGSGGSKSFFVPQTVCPLRGSYSKC